MIAALPVKVIVMSTARRRRILLGKVNETATVPPL
jgi:hypothetical protein